MNNKKQKSGEAYEQPSQQEEFNTYTQNEPQNMAERFGESSPENTPISALNVESEIFQNPNSCIVSLDDKGEHEHPKDQIHPQIADQIIQSYAKKNNTDPKTCIIGITRLVQDGGTNSQKTNMKRMVNGITFDLAELRSTIQFHDKSGTVRKLAKTLRKSIAIIAEINSWPGPLWKDLKRLEPQLDIQGYLSIYCNEIHSDNYDPYVPPKIREALQRREQRLRDQNRLAISSQKKKGKKGRK